MRASCWFLCLKKSAITFGEGCSSHRLRIETDRYVKPKPDVQKIICLYCDRGEVDDEHRSVTPKFVTPTAPSCIDNYYLYTIEQWVLRTWVWCSYDDEIHLTTSCTFHGKHRNLLLDYVNNASCESCALSKTELFCDIMSSKCYDIMWQLGQVPSSLLSW